MADLACLPYGVGHADEGVCLLLQVGAYNVLLDCGLQDMTPLLVDLRRGLKLDLVLCSHAHSDHARGLLELHRHFPRLPIYASEVTTQLLPLNWLGADPGWSASFCRALPWRSPLEFCDGLSVELFPAGHLPGAAVFVIKYAGPDGRTHTIVYTGDCFLSNSRLVDGLPLEELRGLRPDILILEGSYGTARNPRRRQQENDLVDRISRALGEQRSVLLPVPTLGLGQELLMLLRSHHQFTGRDVDIWVDGSVAHGCDAYLTLLPYLPTAVRNFAQHQPLFWDDRVRPHLYRLQTDDQRRAIATKPSIVLTDANQDLHQYIASDSTRWLVLVPQGWTIPPSLVASVAVEAYLLADHCDGPSTMQLIHNLRPQHVVFVHGSPNYLADLTSLDELYSRYQLHVPRAGVRLELPIGESFQQPSIPDHSYEAELVELGGEIVVMLPDTIKADSRWQSFADTGLLTARWQGQELVLRSLSQWELLNQSRSREIPPDMACCANCNYCRNQHCWNPASPLYEFKVTLDGLCPAFEHS
ncbi:MAG: MBL fold metallo-hydrolase [Cyanobacteria bacterium]|nr:MBL fold metallo-hydrolase [Cyanobacteriota bacterium]MDW8201967.1 MBL fold metallo-hydrolase [Cyanobacteriota bacterium SKYGB_h_bin112]